MQSHHIHSSSCSDAQRRHRGFTLVELLVVIGIIALLVSILLPALGKARKSATKIKCANNLRSVGQSLFTYAAANKGYMPCGTTPRTTNPPGINWLWDMPVTTMDLFVAEGPQRKMYYCPEFPDQDVDGLWLFNGIRVLGYVYLIDRGFMSAPPPNWSAPQPLRNGLAYQNKVAPLQPRNPNAMGITDRTITLLPSSETELAADAAPSTNVNGVPFGGVQGGFSMLHQVSHMGRGGAPEGVNVLFMDGHVIWRAWVMPNTNVTPPRDQMQLRTDNYPYWFF
jgi:prepilin-type N-terminal cleavage/methylation domain-containing protein/prepilin-type processing-associated H-X9-DG protein